MKRSIATAVALAPASSSSLAPGRARPGHRHGPRPRRRRAGQPDTGRAGPARLQGPRRPEVPHEDRQERRLHPRERLRRPLPHHAEEGRGRGDLVRLQHPGARPAGRSRPSSSSLPPSAQAAPPPPAPASPPPRAPAHPWTRRSWPRTSTPRWRSRAEGKLDEAIAAYESDPRRARPACPLVHYNLGTAYKKKGDPPKAEAAMRRSFELDPRFVDGYVGLATLLAEAGKQDRGHRGHPAGSRREPAERPAAVRARRARRGHRRHGDRQGGLPEGRAARPAERRDAVPPGHRRPQRERQGRGHRPAREVRGRRPRRERPNVDVAKSLLAALQKK